MRGTDESVRNTVVHSGETRAPRMGNEKRALAMREMKSTTNHWGGIVALACGLAVGGNNAMAEPTGNQKDSEAALTKQLGALPGKKAFLVTQLTEDGPSVRYGKNQDHRFAVGSSFKLFILGTLADEVNAGRRRLDDIMTLRPDLIGPPASELASWPLQSPVTVQTLALKMISISDNTATDHLLYLLGRENVERMMGAMGHGKPSVNQPLLFVREMVQLRDRRHPELAEQWSRSNLDGRRKLLAEGMSDDIDYEALDFDAAAFDVAEWRASPDDMAHALDWIRRNTTDDDPAHPLRGVIAVTTQIEFDRELWPYVGFKGGSEERLIAGNWLMRRRDGKWFTFHFVCNSADEPVDQSRVVDVLKKMLEIIDADLAVKN